MEGQTFQEGAMNDQCEIDILRKSLCLCRQRAEDAESDLAEARLERDLLQVRLDALLPPAGVSKASIPLDEDPKVTRIAAEMVRVMAKNEKAARKRSNPQKGPIP
jgi:hypothetical protein